MPKVCFYFQLHQPYRLQELSLFETVLKDSGVSARDLDYFSGQKDANRAIFQKVATKSYLPMLSLLVKLIEEVPDFKFSLSCSGIFLEQAQKYEPKVIELLTKLSESDRVEFLAETYYHSLASLYSPTEFATQVQQHVDLIQEMFDYTPRIFRNTELIYSNEIAKQVSALGFEGMLTEAVDRYLHGRPKTRIYQSAGEEALPLMLKHAEFSDDLAFRFSDKNWPEYPLTVEKYSRWLSDYYDEEIINLFMDFETFGEHQWQDTGIFDFFEKFVKTFVKSEHNQFVTPYEAISKLKTQSENPSVISKIIYKLKSAFSNSDSYSLQPKAKSLPLYDVPQPISWADVDRDLTAWIENPLQQDTLRALYALESNFPPKADRPLGDNSQDSSLLDTWRKLQTSDHFYYMCTKWAADGDVHAYFSPYETPYEAYRNYCIALSDLKDQLT